MKLDNCSRLFDWLRLFTAFNCSANFNYWVVVNFGTLTNNFETSSNCWDSDNLQFAAVVGLTELSFVPPIPSIWKIDWLGLTRSFHDWTHSSSTAGTAKTTSTVYFTLRSDRIYHVQATAQQYPNRYCNCVLLSNFSNTASKLHEYCQLVYPPQTLTICLTSSSLFNSSITHEYD